MNIDIKRYAKYVFITFVVLSFMLIFIFYLVLYPVKYRNEIKTYANEYSLDTALVAGIISTESSFNPSAKSLKGAVGLMQILPSTAKWVCEIRGIEFDEAKLTEPDYNLQIGCYYLRYLIGKFKNTSTAIVAYNAGEGNVAKWLAEPDYSKDGITLNKIPFIESKNYLTKVNRAKQMYLYRI